MANNSDGLIYHRVHEGLPEARRDSRAPARPATRARAGCGDEPPNPGGHVGNPGRTRNSQRGLRSQVQILARRQARSQKRKEARREHRAQRQRSKLTKHYNNPGFVATAREPDGPKRTLKYKTNLKFLSCNIRGLNKPAKRQQLVNYLTDHQIDIALLQETKVKHKGTENIGNYTFFFSSQTPTKSHPPVTKKENTRKN